LMGKFLVTGRENEIGDMLRCVLKTLVLRMGDGAWSVVGFGFGYAVVCVKSLLMM
jgi:hypothetical protein